MNSSRRSRKKRGKVTPSAAPPRVTQNFGDGTAGWRKAYRPLQPAILALCVAVVVVYSRCLTAGFVGLDDDIHVYANPFLNPPTLVSLAKLWHQQYQGLYIPLAYSILGIVGWAARVPATMDPSVGHTVNLNPIAFHVCGVGFHLINVLLCFFLVRRLTGKVLAALVCALLFALHPLQVESVGWISELRGLSSSGFALLALNLFVLSRRNVELDPRRARRLFLTSTVLVLGAMLCKPTAVILPLVALAIDRAVLATPWRRALLTASIWAATVLPAAILTRSVQVISPQAQSHWWQRPFIAADAVAFYVRKVLAPVDLCVDYGHSPRLAMGHAVVYAIWVVPVGICLLGYWVRRRRPIAWLGLLWFVMFLLPTLGLVPFSFQAHSTVADRYAYLAMIGIGLIVADATEFASNSKVAVRFVSFVLVAFAIVSFNQTRHWLDNTAFLHHTIDVNPKASFAYNNLGTRDLANGDYSAALANFQACAQHDPGNASAYVNQAEVYATLKQPQEAEYAIQVALTKGGLGAPELSNLGLVLMRMNQYARAIEMLKRAVALDPSFPGYLFNEANALAANDQFDEAEAAYRRCITLAPTLSAAHTGLGIVLAQTNRLRDAVAEFRAALNLEPKDEVALDSLKRAQDLLAGHNP